METETQSVAIEEVVADEPNALCIGPFGSDLLASDFVASGTPVVFVRNVRPGRFENTDTRYIARTKAEQLRSHRVRRGDIVITKMGLPACVAAAYPDDAPDGIVTADIIKLTPNKSRVDARYVVHFLNSPTARAQVEKFTFGVTRPKVTLKDFRRLRLPVPPLAEQRRIADILDKADAIHRKRKQAKSLAEELLRSAFLEMFGDPATNPKGWPVRRFGDLIVIPLRNGLSPASGGAHPARVLTLSAITGGGYNPQALKDAVFAIKPGDDVRVDERDFLICRGNGNKDLVGRGAFPTQTGQPPVFPDTMIAARVDQTRIAAAFLAAAWNYKHVRRQLEAGARTTNGTFKINQTVVESIQIALPPREVQAAFERFSLRTARTIASLDNAVANSSHLFETLVARAFRRRRSNAET